MVDFLGFRFNVVVYLYLHTSCTYLISHWKVLIRYWIRYTVRAPHYHNYLLFHSKILRIYSVWCTMMVPYWKYFLFSISVSPVLSFYEVTDSLYIYGDGSSMFLFYYSRYTFLYLYVTPFIGIHFIASSSIFSLIFTYAQNSCLILLLGMGENWLQEGIRL